MTLAGVWGWGGLRADGARFGGMPVFSALGDLFRLFSPAFGGDAMTGLALDYALAGGVLRAGRCVLNVSLFTVETRGDIDLVQRLLAVRGTVRTRGLTGLATTILGQLLEIEANGPWDRWEWRFGRVPGLAENADIRAVRERFDSAAANLTATGNAPAAGPARPRKGFLGRVGDTLTGRGRRETACRPCTYVI